MARIDITESAFPQEDNHIYLKVSLTGPAVNFCDMGEISCMLEAFKDDLAKKINEAYEPIIPSKE